MNASSNQLKKTAEDLSLEFNQIQQEISKINEEMMSASAATEEVNASTEEVNASVTILSSEMENSMKKVSEIKERAGEMTESSTKSYHSATTLSSEFEGKLQNSIEEAKVVENIGEMANVIASIAEEINLLSLNASIEAARAGEQGRGFAVVASEIGKLANETTSAVTQIQETIDRVQNSFRGITENANGLLYFVKDTVTPDYNKFVSVAQQYGEDAESFAEISEKIAEMSETIRSIMAEVTDAIQNIAESSQETAGISGKILTNVDSVSVNVNTMTEMSVKQQSIASDLGKVVKSFKLEK